MNDFLQELADILEVESTEPSAELAQFPAWDSLAQLAVVALVEERYGTTIGSQDLLQARTAGDLYDLIARRVSKRA